MNFWEDKRKLNQVARLLRTHGYLTAYRARFPHRRWRYIVSQWLLYCAPHLTVDELYAIELHILGQPLNQLYSDTLTSINWSNPTLDSINWAPLEEYLRLTYAHFYHQRGYSHLAILYNCECLITQNARRREAFNTWWTSLASRTDKFNNYVLYILSLTQ